MTIPYPPYDYNKNNRFEGVCQIKWNMSIKNHRINWCVNTYPCRGCCERHVNLQVSQMQMLMFACSHHSGNGSEDSGGGDERAHHVCTYVNNKQVNGLYIRIGSGGALCSPHKQKRSVASMAMELINAQANNLDLEFGL